MNTLKQFISASVVAGMLLGPTVADAQQNQSKTREPVSKSLVQSTSEQLSEVLSRVRSGATQPGDFARLETAWRIQFEHMEASGINERLDYEIRTHRAQLAAMTVTDEVVDFAYARAEEVDSTMTKNEVRTALTKSVAQLHKFLDEFETVGGVRGYEARLLAYAHARSVAAEKQVGYRHIRCCGPICAATEAEGGLLAAGFGVAVLFGCVPCGAIGAGLLFGTALVQWLCV